MAREHLTEFAKREMAKAAFCESNPFSQEVLSRLGEIGGAIEKQDLANGDTVFYVTDDFLMEVLWEIRNQRARKQNILDACVALSKGKQGPRDTAN